jgi:hypothetical protein
VSRCRCGGLAWVESRHSTSQIAVPSFAVLPFSVSRLGAAGARVVVGCGGSAPARLQGGLGGLSCFIGWAGGWVFSRLIRLILNHLPSHPESFAVAVPESF